MDLDEGHKKKYENEMNEGAKSDNRTTSETGENEADEETRKETAGNHQRGRRKWRQALQKSRERIPIMELSRILYQIPMN